MLLSHKTRVVHLGIRMSQYPRFRLVNPFSRAMCFCQTYRETHRFVVTSSNTKHCSLHKVHRKETTWMSQCKFNSCICRGAVFPTSLVSHKGYDNNVCMYFRKAYTLLLQSVLSLSFTLFPDVRFVPLDFKGEIVCTHEQSKYAVIENCQQNLHQCCPSAHLHY